MAEAARRIVDPAARAQLADLPELLVLLDATGDWWLRTEQAAAIIDVSPDTLAAWRSDGGGPPYTRLRNQRLVRYRLRDVLEWLLVNRVRSTAEESVAHPRSSAPATEYDR